MNTFEQDIFHELYRTFGPEAAWYEDKTSDANSSTMRWVSAWFDGSTVSSSGVF